MKGKKERMKNDSIYQVFKQTSEPTKGGLILLSMLCPRGGGGGGGGGHGIVLSIFLNLFLEQRSFLFIDVIVNKYFHINLQQEEQ